jgi:hypothetical protein
MKRIGKILLNDKFLLGLITRLIACPIKKAIEIDCRKVIIIGCVFFLAISLFSTTETKGQDSWHPKGNINMFQSLDTTTQAKEYNKLTLRVQRDSAIDARLKEDWLDQIAGRITPTIWVCNQYEQQLEINSHDWGDNIYDGDKPIYNWYKGDNLEEIYTNRGTLKDQGKLGLPTHGFSLYDEITMPGGHGMNIIATGDTLTNFKAWNLIEPQRDGTNVKPGQYYFPTNCKLIQIYYTYLFKGQIHDKNYYNFRVLEFEVTDGVAKLTYNVNEDTRLVPDWDKPADDPSQWMNNFARIWIPLNERVHLITTRKELADIKTGINKVRPVTLVRIYPTPATDYINIDWPNNSNELQVKIYSIDGRLQQTSVDKKTINIEQLNSGLYLVQITAGMRIYNGKFLKK